MQKNNGSAGLVDKITGRNKDMAYKGALIDKGFITHVDESKINLISGHFREIMQILGMDISDPAIAETPTRIATLYVKEISSGLNLQNKPVVSLPENKYHYNQVVMERNIPLHSWCEHYFLPLTGKLHVAYVSRGKIISSQQLNSIVKFHCSKPQAQARLTEEIANSLKESLESQDIAVIIDVSHPYPSAEYTNANNRSSLTTHYSGKFQNEDTRRDVFHFLHHA